MDLLGYLDISDFPRVVDLNMVHYGRIMWI